MILVLIIVALLFFIIVSLGFTKIQIIFDTLEVSFPQENHKFINDNYNIILKGLFLNKFPIFKTEINKSRFSNNKIINLQKNFNVKKIDMRSLKKINNLNVKEIDVKIDLGLHNPAVTAIGVGIVSTIISIISSFKADNIETIKYEVRPIYQKFLLKIYFKGIFEINMIHIIYIIYSVLKKGREDNGRTSNRRTYAHSHE